MTKNAIIAMAASVTLGAASASAAAPSAMHGKLAGKRVAILVTDGFEQSEMVEPRRALDAAGATTVLVSPKTGEVKAWSKGNWGDKFPVDRALDDAKADDFDALLLPGGVMNPDALRINAKAVAFVTAMVGKPIAAICHGPWTLVEAGAVKGRKLTSWPSLKTDIKNAGGTWTDSEVVVDRELVTSRKPADIPAFNAKMIEVISEGRRERATK